LPGNSGANGQGRTKDEARESLAKAIALIWTNPATGAVEAVPRHTEIPNLLARKICRDLGIPQIGE
jgi:hypothetical protein